MIVRAVEGVEEFGIYTFRLYAYAFDEAPDVGNGMHQLVGRFDAFQITVLDPSNIVEE